MEELDTGPLKGSASLRRRDDNPEGQMPRSGRGRGRGRGSAPVAWRGRGSAPVAWRARGSAPVARRGRDLSMAPNTSNNCHNPVQQQSRSLSSPRQQNRRSDDNVGTFNPRNDKNMKQFGNNRNAGNARRGQTRNIGFKGLEEIANSESQDVIVKMIQGKEKFLEILQSPIERDDVFILVIKCLEKVCLSSFDELKMKLLIDTCNSLFIMSLKNYLMELPYVKSKSANRMYWDDQDSFWKNVMFFYETIMNAAPTLTMNKCRSLIEISTDACLSGLKDRHEYNLPDELSSRLKALRERMANYEKIIEKPTGTRPRQRNAIELGAPPENFRELSLIPNTDDLINMKPFVRPNIVDGAYEDVEHYLDVQFRLLREDCFGPLRVGLNQYLRDVNKRKYDNIRVFQNVKITRPYVSQTKIGSLVQIDLKVNKSLKRINWSNTKRFIFGALVLLTKDNCKSFLVGTIIDHVPSLLMDGMIPISFVDMKFDVTLYNSSDTYTLIESDVYFEPYFHVLKALQDPTFPEHLAMKQYIVEVNPEPKHPSYLSPSTEYEVETTNADLSEVTKFTVLEENTWPGKERLSFNDSQLEAYKLALTHELAVVQGPPGTGKTYLGIKVAQTLLSNLKDSMKNGCILLLICYTNHALDQFLSALMDTTESIIRVGGQSRNEIMENINLTKLRKEISDCDANRMFRQLKFELNDAISSFRSKIPEADVLINGVVKSRFILSHTDVLEMNWLLHFYQDSNESGPLYRWLFENYEQYYSPVNKTLLEEDITKNAYLELEKETRKRLGVKVEDDGESKLTEAYKNIAVFSLHVANSEILILVSEYRNAVDDYNKRLIQEKIQYLQSHKDLFNDMLQHRNRRVRIRITEKTNFDRIPYADRWALYFQWTEGMLSDTKRDIAELQAKVETAAAEFEEARMLLDMEILKSKQVVGMTTSGAARLRKMLQTLAPPIVIVEEAAEVLEQHIVTSLTKDCKHLILIGDHQQLRPSAAHMALARDYNIEVSLFERLISNGVHSRRLAVQHRMRPHIAALIAPHIYADLCNHPSVHDFPDVKGLSANLFFFTHDHREQEVVENMSKTNHEEGELLLALANYLRQQGYSADDVTILAAYKGQMFYMKKESAKYILLKDVKITVVDNYQGEESKIILLSLVRNNVENKIGFLGTPNRICVALSRAKEGFYIFGNIDNLKASSELWRNIAETLESGDSLGRSLTLKCQNHPDSLITVVSVADFEQSPEGGCRRRCDHKLPRCGHLCELFCHGYDRDHTTPYTRCKLKCERVLCELNHICPKICSEDCGPCKRKLPKTLPCGHEMYVHCYLEPDDPSIKCNTLVEVTLPDCGHTGKKMCSLKIENAVCEKKCEYRVDKCGHSCLRTCHVKNDPDHAKYECRKPCARAKKDCKAGLLGDRGHHQCPKSCHEDCDPCTTQVIKRRSNCNHMVMMECHVEVDKKPCMKNCARLIAACGHHCKRKCSEPCGDCKVMVYKEISDCKHKATIQCRLPAVRENCTSKCERTMSCGHKCRGMCKDECDPSLCTELSDRKVDSPCGHQVTLPCNMAALPADKLEAECVMGLCGAACGGVLRCGHACAGSCARCRRGRLHAPCAQRCQRPNICSHLCEEPCNKLCPPCKKRCEMRCEHARCGKLCGAPCTPCQEACGRGCVHGRCVRRCGEACSRAPCEQACARALPCGHACRGLCGEPCPPVCRLCRPDTFPRDFLGDECDHDARFVVLADCGHVVEVTDMDGVMMTVLESVSVPRCPFCRAPVINTPRYKDLIANTFKNDINPIKVRVYGTRHEIHALTNELDTQIQNLTADVAKVQMHGFIQIERAYNNIVKIFKSTRSVSKLHLNTLSICLNLLKMIVECTNLYIEAVTEKPDAKKPRLFGMPTGLQATAVLASTAPLKKEFNAQIEMLCSVFYLQTGGILKISEQQQYDMNLEIKRLNSIVQLAKIIVHTFYISVKEKVAATYNTAYEAVFGQCAFNEDAAIQALEKLQEAIKVSGLVTKQERELIVQAIGLKAGHWYKCPNGHFYCIGECGGAMEMGKCPECGADIGGASHSLTAGNEHAPEMDGSKFAAWSQEYNNMANFRLD